MYYIYICVCVCVCVCVCTGTGMNILVCFVSIGAAVCPYQYIVYIFSRCLTSSSTTSSV